MANLPSNASQLTLTQIAQTGCDYINHSVAAHVFANSAMKNIYQGEIEKGGRGVTSEYSSDTTGSSITVVRPLPLPIRARELGSAINGGNFSAFQYQPASDAYTLQIITVIDDIVDIPGVTMDMIPVKVAQMYIDNIGDKVTLNVNAIKIAAAVYTSLSAEAAKAGSANITRFQTGDKLLKKALSTYAALDKGDLDHGVAMFPQDNRIGLITVDHYVDLLAEGVITVGGANYAYTMVEKGVVSQGAKQDKLNDGYIGDVFGIPYHTVSPLVWATACSYLGFPSNTLDEVLEIVKSAHGNLFALATGNSIKTIDSPDGQGIRLQPKYRMGCACIMPKTNSFLVTSHFENPYLLKEVLTSNTIEWGYKAPGSRNELKLTVTPSAGKKFTVSESTGKALVEGAWVVGEVHSLSDFVAAYNAQGAVKGKVAAFGVESAALVGVNTNDVVNFVAVDADGTLVLASGKALA